MFLAVLSAVAFLALWVFVAVRVAEGVCAMPVLASLPAADGGPLPGVSIIFAARDEAQAVRSACGSMLCVDYSDLEVIAIDDRSRDATGDVLNSLAEAQGRLRVLHVGTLPAGWLGKTYALHLGVDVAKYDYLLLTDADVHFRADVLRRAMIYVRDNDVDHLVVLPRLLNAGRSLRCMLPPFLVTFFMKCRPRLVNSDAGGDGIGIGAFNLVRREALDAIGGLERIRLRPDEDLRLGRVLRSAGFRQRVVSGDGLVEVEWYRRAGEMIRGMEKNGFALQEYRVWRVVWGCLAMGLLFQGPLIALYGTGGLASVLSGCATFVAVVLHVWAAKQMKIGACWGLLYPIGAALMIVALLNSAAQAIRRGGIVWRDTYYSLEDLRKNRV